MHITLGSAQQLDEWMRPKHPHTLDYIALWIVYRNDCKHTQREIERMLHTVVYKVCDYEKEHGSKLKGLSRWKLIKGLSEGVEGGAVT